MGTLTDLRLKALKRAGQPCAVADGDGLTFTLSKRGTAAWTLRYRFGGKQREITVGNYPDLTIAAARDAAAKLRVRVNDGEDVAATKRATKLDAKNALTIKALAEDYLRVSATMLRPSSLAQRTRLLDKEVIPFIGQLRADAVSAAELIRVIERTADRSQSTAHITFVSIRGMYSHAIAKRLIETDPTARLKFSAIVGAIEPRRERRILKRDELREFVRQLPALGEDNEHALRIILLTGVRKNEFQLARWDEVDLDKALWTIPPERAKKGRGYVVPLPAAAVASFTRLKELAGSYDLVFPQHAGRSRGKATSPGRLNYAMTLLAGMDDLTPHDLRATMRSYLGELGVRVEVAERCLNHSLGGMVEVYDKSDYIEERRRALERWASVVDAIACDEHTNVTPLIRSA